MKDKEIIYSKLNDMDLLDSSPKTLQEIVCEAIKEAVKREIKANTIVINERLIETQPFVFKHLNTYSEFPPMICGLEAHIVKDQLPNEYGFAILENPNKQKTMTFEELKAEANRQGYSLVKKPTYVPLAKCPCGAKLSVKAYDTIYGHAYKCIKCGLESYPSKTHKGARENWNKEFKR